MHTELKFIFFLVRLCSQIDEGEDMIGALLLLVELLLQQPVIRAQLGHAFSASAGLASGRRLTNRSLL